MDVGPTHLSWWMSAVDPLPRDSGEFLLSHRAALWLTINTVSVRFKQIKNLDHKMEPEIHIYHQMDRTVDSINLWSEDSRAHTINVVLPPETTPRQPVYCNVSTNPWWFILNCHIQCTEMRIRPHECFWTRCSVSCYGSTAPLGGGLTIKVKPSCSCVPRSAQIHRLETMLNRIQDRK